MTITQQTIARLQQKEIIRFRLENAAGASVELMNYGATLLSWFVPGSSGQLENIILSYNKIEDYFSNPFYLGSTVGRFANRISQAQFVLEEKTYFLDKNDGRNSNHGGFKGFHSRIFDYEVQKDRLVFSYESPDGEGGFPGNLRFSAAYSLSEENELTIEYKAVSDQATPFNPTNHAYFNLSGKAGNVLDHELKVYAGHYLETNDEFIPTGKINPLPGTAFDFRDYQKISGRMPLKKEILPGYNTYFVAQPANSPAPRLLASLREPQSGRRLDVYSTLPGIQIYTGDYLSSPFQAFAGIALEAQFYPDAPNHPHFPSTILFPEKETKQTIIFSVQNPLPL
jgi:aldose 1-epimerase